MYPSHNMFPSQYESTIEKIIEEEDWFILILENRDPFGGRKFDAALSKKDQTTKELYLYHKNGAEIKFEGSVIMVGPLPGYIPGVFGGKLLVDEKPMYYVIMPNSQDLYPEFSLISKIQEE